jgi:leucine-rich repeat protein SHOC2
VPAELGQLAALEGLYLYDNRLTGSVPAALGQLAALKELGLHNN